MTFEAPEQPWVAYVGRFAFPWGQPSSRRVYGVARAITASGYEVVVVTETDEADSTDVLAGEQRIRHVNLGPRQPGKPSKIRRLLQLTFTSGHPTTRWLKTLERKPVAIIVYGGPLPYLLNVGRWARRNRVPVVADVVEWYEPAHLIGGRIGPLSIASAFEHRVLHRRLDGVITISRFLDRHYRGQGLTTLRVPPTFERMAIGSPSLANHNNDPVRVAYCGTPGRKDALGKIIAAVAEVPNVVLTIAGPTLEQLSTYAPHGLPPNVRPAGRVEQRAVAEIVRHSDFTVLVREQTRSARAGFPTKFVESIAAGTPVLCNVTSDLGDYLVDGINGLTFAEPTHEHLVETLRRAAAMTLDERVAMRMAAHDLSKAFEWQTTATRVGSFLRLVTHGR